MAGNRPRKRCFLRRLSMPNRARSRLGWKMFENRSRVLADRIRKDFSPDLIVGIVRGGLVPTRVMSSLLGVKGVHTVNVKKQGEKRVMVGSVPQDLKGKRVLLVEDMLETGRSLIVAKQALERRGAQVKTLAYYIQPHSEIIPDYHLGVVKKGVKFPWEL